MSEEILRSILNDRVLSELALTFLITYGIKLLSKPTKYEAKFLARFLTILVLFLIDLLKRWHKKHPQVLSDYLDRVYSKVFNTRHYTPRKESGKMIVG